MFVWEYCLGVFLLITDKYLVFLEQSEGGGREEEPAEMSVAVSVQEHFSHRA